MVSLGLGTNFLGFREASFFSIIEGIFNRDSSNKRRSRGRSLNKEIGIL